MEGGIECTHRVPGSENMTFTFHEAKQFWRGGLPDPNTNASGFRAKKVKQFVRFSACRIYRTKVIKQFRNPGRFCEHIIVIVLL